MKFAIDLYSGIGGWTLGMKLSNIKNCHSYEWWNEANRTHNLNFKTSHQEFDIRKLDPEKDLEFEHQIDFVVGSPPCTQFSYSNKGGSGNIADGLIDIYKFLEVVDYLKPKYWAMENVPRVAKIIESEIVKGSLKKFKHLFTTIEVIDSADYGLPQHRKRMIAGNYPFELLNSYKQKTKQKTIKDVMDSLSGKSIQDPNYCIELPKSSVSELENEALLTTVETRINRDSKVFHPIYNKMSFPDRLDRPSGTITATCTRLSRESIIVKSKSGFRRLNVRERGVLQGFPITYQFYGNSLNSKFKMIGNAVPPILTYYVFQSMLETPLEKLKLVHESNYKHQQPKESVKPSKLDAPNRKYPANRRFRFAVPNLRYGSGVRFELSNDSNSNWLFKFFYGNSKNVKSIDLDSIVLSLIRPKLSIAISSAAEQFTKKLHREFKDFSSEKLQLLWSSPHDNNQVFEFIDSIGLSANELTKVVEEENIDYNLIRQVVGDDSKKIKQYKNSLMSGFILLSSLNERILKS